MRWLRLPSTRLAIRWKFLSVMVAIAIVPLIISAWLEVRSVAKLGEELAAESGRTVNERTRQSLQRSLHQLIEMINRAAETAELIARLQARHATHVLTQPLPEKQLASELLWTNDFTPLDATEEYQFNAGNLTVPINRKSHALFSPNNEKTGQVLDSAKTLQGMQSFFLEINRTHASLFRWQYVALENGLLATYPGHSDYPQDFDVRERDWYKIQKSRRELTWSPPHTDAVTGLPVINVTMPLITDSGEFLGVSGLDVRIASFLRALQLPLKFEYDSETLIAALVTDPVNQTQSLFIVAESSH
ncbi:MAG: PDC sensor domain-containing protein, partial [Pseudomonadota bacterium]